jgi:hypothetical protein
VVAAGSGSGDITANAHAGNAGINNAGIKIKFRGSNRSKMERSVFKT